MSNFHNSVLLKEVIDYLQIQPGKRYIDATLGGGGHTKRILELGGKVLGIDVDEEAIEYVLEKLRVSEGELRLVKGNFRNIDELARANGFGHVSGILFDLGVSSHQLDTAERGFSFAKIGRLDMRMDQGLDVTAKDLLNVLTKGELYALFIEYGEERFSKKIASHIVESRRIKSIETTRDLETIVRSSVPVRDYKTNPATRVFQALRIAVNDELDSLNNALPKSFGLLEDKGRIVVIAFHSLEDKIVKHTFATWEEQRLGTIITKKPVLPTESEIKINSRSRSAKMRVFEKN